MLPTLAGALTGAADALTSGYLEYVAFQPHISSDLAVEIARLGLVHEASETTALLRVTELATRTVNGCAGATGRALGATASRPSRSTRRAATPTSPISATRSARAAPGPSSTSAARRRPRSSAPTPSPRPAGPTTRRGPAARRPMLRHHRLPHRAGARDAHDVRRHAGRARPAELSLGSLLAAQGGAAVSNTRRYEDAHRTAVQLKQAVEARAVVDQAKGVLMHAMGCDAETAFNELKRISQTRHVKLTALAQRIVAGHVPGTKSRTDPLTPRPQGRR